jgi:hypothetical protein
VASDFIRQNTSETVATLVESCGFTPVAKQIPLKLLLKISFDSRTPPASLLIIIPVR